MTPVAFRPKTELLSMAARLCMLWPLRLQLGFCRTSLNPPTPSSHHSLLPASSPLLRLFQPHWFFSPSYHHILSLPQDFCTCWSLSLEYSRAPTLCVTPQSAMNSCSHAGILRDITPGSTLDMSSNTPLEPEGLLCVLL